MTPDELEQVMRRIARHPGDRMEINARSYCEGHEAGVAEGMSRVLDELLRGHTLGDAVRDGARSSPRIFEELRRRSIVVDGASLLVEVEAPGGAPFTVRYGFDDTWISQHVGKHEPVRLPAPAPVEPPVMKADPPTPPHESPALAAQHGGERLARAYGIDGAGPARPTELHGTRAAGAVFSGGGAYRYLLWRIWGDDWGNVLAFVKHNPSTAGAGKTDVTTTAAVKHARRLGYDGVVIANLAALVATDPGALKGIDCKTLAGPQNGRALRLVLRHARTVVAAWGNPSGHPKNMQALATRFAQLARERGRELDCLGPTNAGNHPRHLAARGSSRIPDDAKLQRWTP